MANTTCDFCGDHSTTPYLGQFKTRHGVTLCAGCSDPIARGTVQSGTHFATFAEDGSTWRCSCGETFLRPTFTPAAVVDALPNIVSATAFKHVTTTPGGKRNVQ